MFTNTWRAGRCAEAAFYPIPLVKAMIRGMSLQQDVDRIGREEMEEQRSPINAITNASAEIPKTTETSVRTSKVTKVDGTVIPITCNPCQFKPKYVDEYTGELLEPSLISETILDELEYFNDHVWRIEDQATMLAIKDHIFARSCWVMCNKGDHIEPDMRARLVACEVNKKGKSDLFHASTPSTRSQTVAIRQICIRAPQKRQTIEAIICWHPQSLLEWCAAQRCICAPTQNAWTTA